MGLNWYLIEIGWNIYREYTDVTGGMFTSLVQTISFFTFLMLCNSVLTAGIKSGGWEVHSP